MAPGNKPSLSARISRKTQRVVRQTLAVTNPLTIWRNATWALSGLRGYVISRRPNNVRLKLYKDSYLSKRIFLQDFEASELALLARFLRPHDTFVDVGANIGLYTVTAAAMLRGGGEVHAFEPGLRPFQRLLENITLNHLRNVRFYRMALSDCRGMSTLSAGTTFDAFNTMSGVPIHGSENDFETENVATGTLDDVKAGFSTPMNRDVAVFVKIDVEGWEEKVLAGGRQFIRDTPNLLLQVEFTEAAAVAAGTSCGRLFDTLVEHGLTVCRYHPQTNEFVPEVRQETYRYANLFATRDIAFVRDRLSGAERAKAHGAG